MAEEYLPERLEIQVRAPDHSREWSESITVCDDGEDVGGEVVAALRARAAGRASYHLRRAVLLLDHFDFDAPNQPTKGQVGSLHKAARQAFAAIDVLYTMAPHLFDDDDDDGDEPDDDPEPPPVEREPLPVAEREEGDDAW